MKNLFVYGTLMCDDIMEEVAGGCFPHEPGTLRGFSRRSVIGELYPALTEDAGGMVRGMLYRNLTDSARARLDRFEGEMYRRCPVRIELEHGETVSADTYVARPESLERLAPVEWDFAEFLRLHKARFQGHYQGYRSLEPEEATRREASLPTRPRNKETT